VFIKICGITNEEDALAVTALGADALGFNFVPSSSRHVTVGKASDIIKRLPPDVLTVGIFRDEDPTRVVTMALKAGVKAVQLHGHETPAQASEIRSHFPVLIVAMPAGDPKLESFDRFNADALLLDAPTPGSGKVFDWAMAEGLPVNRRLILSGGLTPENVVAGIEQVRPWGVDTATGVESSPGIKDPMKVRAFIRAARSVDVDQWEIDRPGPFDWAESSWI
jgi:phosphoribosylanthranilate isomerase